MTCGCGLQVTEGGLLRHRRGSHHLSWLKGQAEVSEKDKPIPFTCDRMMCECGCELSIAHSPTLYKHNINRHKQTEKHIKRMMWIVQGLDPDEEEDKLDLQRTEASLNSTYRRQGLPEIKLVRENGKLVQYEL